jgi:glycerophosphoryl diester phosphodiesterase
MSTDYDLRCNSLKEAVNFAKFSDLLGIVSHCDPLIEAPFLINAIKENGLLLFSYGQANNDAKKVALQRKFGLDAVIVDKILPILGSLSVSP